MKPVFKLWRMTLKTVLLLLLFNFAALAFPAEIGGDVSVYNRLVRGRERLPYGEDSAQSYNLSLFDIEAMFATHILAIPKADDEYRVIVIGDSSVWGMLLRPQETLTGQLNVLRLKTADGLNARFYNVGYPTLSLTKDLLLLDEALNYKPDLIIWMVTLESFPTDKQLNAPLVAHNPARVLRLAEAHGLKIDPKDKAFAQPAFWDATLVGRRRALADWYRLQVYGLAWHITGVDQTYPENYEPAQTNFELDVRFHDWEPPKLPVSQLTFDLVDVGFRVASDTPMILINEPILISNGSNSDLRYNYYYPRWAYDQYRTELTEYAAKNNYAYLDLWDMLPKEEFTNSAVHLSPAGETLLAQRIGAIVAGQSVR